MTQNADRRCVWVARNILFGMGQQRKVFASVLRCIVLRYVFMAGAALTHNNVEQLLIWTWKNLIWKLSSYLLTCRLTFLVCGRKKKITIITYELQRNPIFPHYEAGTLFSDTDFEEIITFILKNRPFKMCRYWQQDYFRVGFWKMRGAAPSENLWYIRYYVIWNMLLCAWGT